MLIVIPITPKDAHLAQSVEKSFQKFPPGSNHSLLVVSAPNAKEQATDLLNKLRGFFVNAAQETFINTPTGGWPFRNNFFFQQTCYVVSKYAKPNQGWLWFEMDSVPLTANWMDYLEQEYYADSQRAHTEGRSMHRFMGAKEQTLTSVGGQLDQSAGFHMASVGIYPGDFGVTCPVLTGINSNGKHFSTALKWYTTISKGSQALNISPLIQNNRDTSNYREEEGCIVCDGIARNAFGVQFNESLSEEAVLLHGCKDGSLIEIVPTDRKINLQLRPQAQRIQEQIVEKKPNKMFVQLPPKEAANPFPQLTSMNPVQSLLNRGVPPVEIKSIERSPNSIHPLHVGGRQANTSSYQEHRQKLAAQREEEKAAEEASRPESPADLDDDYNNPNPELAEVVAISAKSSEPAAIKPVPKSYKKGRKKLNLSPEERERRAENMRQLVAKRREAKEAVAA